MHKAIQYWCFWGTNELIACQSRNDYQNIYASLHCNDPYLYNVIVLLYIGELWSGLNYSWENINTQFLIILHFMLFKQTVIGKPNINKSNSYNTICQKEIISISHHKICSEGSLMNKQAFPKKIHPHSVTEVFVGLWKQNKDIFYLFTHLVGWVYKANKNYHL